MRLAPNEYEFSQFSPLLRRICCSFCCPFSPFSAPQPSIPDVICEQPDPWFSSLQFVLLLGCSKEFTSADLVFPSVTFLVLHCAYSGKVCPAVPWGGCASKFPYRLWQQRRATRPNQTWEKPPSFWCTEGLRKSSVCGFFMSGEGT